MDSRPIVIIGPMDSESSLLISALENPREEHEGAYSFHIGELYGAPAVVCRCYIGVVNSAAAATIPLGPSAWRAERQKAIRTAVIWKQRRILSEFCDN